MEYWGLNPVEGVVTAWIALGDIPQDSGPVRYVPGSHAFRVPHVRTKDFDNTLYFKQKVSSNVDESSAVTAVMSAGEATVHHPLVVHCSDSNASAEPRVALAVRFVASNVRSVRRDSAAWVRGLDLGHFDLEPRPKSDFDADAMEAHRRAMSVQAARVR
jgi:ectoine hydroxylase-related dioxygenase (phytanoyl-CoA dioxygenase family)